MGFDHCEQLRLGMARPADMPRLTVREREVLRRITDGQSTRQIARDLAITSSTARTHANNVLLKLGARSRIQAAAVTSPPPRARPREPDLLAELTRRERDVLACMVEGMAQAAMAERLCLSRHTVRTHVRNILAKLGAHSTLEVAALVRRIEEPEKSAARQFSKRQPREHRPGERLLGDGFGEPWPSGRRLGDWFSEDWSGEWRLRVPDRLRPD
jgi:DNA-binding CsgD family transcriptional regulator